jgi:hypothetical protein
LPEWEAPAEEQKPASAAGAAPNALAEFAKFILTQWIAGLITYEALAAIVDRKGRLLPAVGF